MDKFDLRQLVSENWQILSLYALLFLTVVFTLLFRLNSLVPGYTSSELKTLQSTSSFGSILHNPVNAPYKIIGRLFYNPHTVYGVLYLRRLSVLIAFLSLIVFGLLLYYWHNHRTALIGTLLFATSGWFLHTARAGTPDILMFGIFALFAGGVWLRRTESWLALIAGIVLSSALIYVPGMIWFIGLAIIFNWKTVDRVFKKHKLIVTLGTLLIFAMVAPLAWAIHQKPIIARQLVNLPVNGYPKPLNILHDIAMVPVRVFVYGQSNPSAWLDHMPVLSVFTGVMFLLGVYMYFRKYSFRLRQLLLFLVVGTLAMGLGGSMTLTALVPFIYLLVAAGTESMLSQWFNVFPRNPIAQWVGISSFSVLVLLAVIYQTRQYYIAWPLNNSTKSAYIYKISDIKSSNSATIRT